MTQASVQHRGILLVVLVSAMAAGVVFNFSMTSVSAPLIDEFGITDGQFGLITTVIFISAALVATVFGLIADKIRSIWQLAIIMFGTITAFIISVLWHSYAGFLIAGCFAGITQAISNPATNRIISRRVPAHRVPKWMGWKQSGIQMAMLVTGFSVPLLFVLGTWILAAGVMVAVCLAAFGLAWWVLRAPRRELAAQKQTARADADSIPTTVGQDAALPPSVYLLAVICLLNAVGTQAVNTYAALFSVREMGFAVSVGGVLLGVIGLVGMSSRVLWGRVNGAWGRPAPLLALMSIGGVLGLSALGLASATGQVWLLWLGVGMHAVFPLAANVVVNSAVIAAAPVAKVGRASGLVAAAMYTGFAVGPALIGAIIDTTGQFNAGWLAVAGTYILCWGLAFMLTVFNRRGR